MGESPTPPPPYQAGPAHAAPPNQSQKWLWIVIGCVVFAGLVGVVVLAAILFPVFNQAKQGAKRSMTMSSMKQLSMGLSMYTEEHSGRFPIEMASTQAVMPALMPFVQSEAPFRSHNPDGGEFEWNGSLAGKTANSFDQPGRMGFASDSMPWRGSGGRVVGFLDGSARNVNATRYEEGRGGNWIFPPHEP